MDTNRLIKIEELEIGDEFITSSNSHMKYYKVIKKPAKNPKSGRWKGVRCSENIIIQRAKRWVRKRGSVDVDIEVHVCTPKDHNHQKLVYGLQWRDMWLVKREEVI